jgi:hypothetical protein
MDERTVVPTLYVVIGLFANYTSSFFVQLSSCYPLELRLRSFNWRESAITPGGINNENLFPFLNDSFFSSGYTVSRLNPAGRGGDFKIALDG